MRFKAGLAAVMLFAVGTTGVAYGQEDIIALRQQLMKTNGAAAAVAVKMLRDEIPFDAAVAAAAVESIAHDNEVFPALFPAGSETGGNTKAGPAIWSDTAGFKAASEAAVTAATAAAAAAAQGKEAFGTAFGAVGAACQACHEKYRAG
jgi:cytochrome c556